MSFDLGLWYSPRALGDDQADRVYQALAEGSEVPADAPIAPSPAVAAFLADLGARYPDLDTLADDEVDDSPWASGFESSDRHVLLNIRWHSSDEVLTAITELAAAHGLVLYDPQGETVHLPPALEPPPAPPPPPRKGWQFWRR